MRDEEERRVQDEAQISRSGNWMNGSVDNESKTTNKKADAGE